jgi:metal-sulfur cluster biosynthetic enzyme
MAPRRRAHIRAAERAEARPPAPMPQPAPPPPAAPMPPAEPTMPAAEPSPASAGALSGAGLTVDGVMNALKPVCDPEIGLSIVDLGLIYGVDISPDGKEVAVTMTLTTPMCPYGPELLGQATAALSAIPGVEDGKIVLVWVPRWDPREHASEEAKAYLGIW